MRVEYLGLNPYRDYIGIMENKMETTIVQGFRVLALFRIFGFGF